MFSSKVLNSLDSMKELAPIALDCVRSFQVNPSFAFTIADYGSADGGNSMPLIYACVEELRKLHGSALEILIFYEDQPTNDFTSVFSILQGTRSLQTNSKHFKSSPLFRQDTPSATGWYQISEHVFAPNGDSRVYYPSNLLRNASSFENWATYILGYPPALAGGYLVM